MFLRAVLLLLLVVAASVAATLYFGSEVLIALGLLLTQAKVVAKKLVQIELPAVLAWFKYELAQFFRVELLKRWAMTTALPLVVGTALLRRIKSLAGRYIGGVRQHYAAMIGWFRDLDWYVKVVMALIVLSATVALSVTTIGLWLILFSVKLPLWIAAGVSSLVQMVWASLRKSAFKAAAFFQLGWAWRILRRRLPPEVLKRKRRFDFRVARMVVRQRRMTLRQLTQQKNGLSMRLALWAQYWRSRRDP